MSVRTTVLAIYIGLTVFGRDVMVMANSTGSILTVSCSVPPKSRIAANVLCTSFVERLSLAMPGKQFVIAELGEEAAITLDMRRVAPNGLEGRILMANGDQGQLLGMAFADRTLGKHQLFKFMDDLIISMQQ